MRYLELVTSDWWPAELFVLIRSMVGGWKEDDSSSDSYIYFLIPFFKKEKALAFELYT